MSELQNALSTLKRTSYSDVPIHDLTNYLRHAFQEAEFIANSVPPPPGGDDFSVAHRTRTDPRPAKTALEVTTSNVRPPPPDKTQADLQKAWGKPMKLGAKDNPLGVSVFKMAGHDRHGAWFARRSIHEGLGFKKWQRAMQSEFPESLAIHKGPGEGSVRGIGGDRVLEREEVKGMGKLEVLELSAKFPPPTSPRDFVTLLLTTESGLSKRSAIRPKEHGANEIIPRSWMVVSIPIEHPEAPPRDGLVRGQYESVELIREIPLASCNEQSTGDDDEAELNPIEWIMVTRSDPGGGIPRFLVDRGTPPSIAADTVKFLDWACARHDDDVEATIVKDDHAHHDGRRPSYTSFHQSFTAGVDKDLDRPMVINQPRADSPDEEPRGLFTSVTNTIGQTIAANTPDMIQQRLPGLFPNDGHESDKDSTTSSSVESFASAELYHTAEAGDESHDSTSTPMVSQTAIAHLNSANASQKSFDSVASPAPSKDSDGHHITHSKRELAKIEEKKSNLEKKMAATREKQEKATRQVALRSEEDSSKSRERHERDIRKHEERHAKEMLKLEERKEKETRKLEARRRKEEERNKLLMMQRERNEWKQKAEMLGEENDILRERVGELQRENTLLVAKLGSTGQSGHDLLKLIMEEQAMNSALHRRGTSVGSKGSRTSEDSSLRKKLVDKIDLVGH